MSSFVRIYVPMSADHLRSLTEDASLSSQGLQVFAVTEAFRAVMPASEDQEGLEYAVLQDAATYAAAQGRRVVGAADVAESQVTERGQPDDPAGVLVEGDIPRRRFASLHVLDEAGERDPDADLELSWYDITELDQVRDLA